jgi:ubiquinone/menaquinone biosynthesis C-methylase UbiE
MNKRLESLLENTVLEPDKIYSSIENTDTVQNIEIKLREKVASKHYDDYLAAIANSHSVTVMDYEVERFLSKLPANALILDIGGCWGWHWRNLAEKHPNVSVVIMDFVRPNLVHAKNVLGDLVGKQVALMHADATNLPFHLNEKFRGFDGVWTVQTFQHIPDFSKAVFEAHRVLIKGGYFANYSLHKTPFNRFVYKCLGKKFHIKGEVAGSYYLERANNTQRDIIFNFFGEDNLEDRFTECLFHPDLKLGFTGRVNSIFGIFDIWLSKIPVLGQVFGRQRVFLAKKMNINY